MYRRKKDIKAQVVYDKLGICQSTYSKIDNNKYKIDIHTLKNIAEILEIDVTKLLEEEELSTNRPKDDEKKVNAIESNLHSEKLIESLQNQIKLLQEQIQYLKKELKKNKP